MTLFYLHGFASSPFGNKVSWLRDKLEEEKGLDLVVPDLNVPSFARLSLTSIIEKIAEEIEKADEPVHLIGSSFGGLAALHFYDRYRNSTAHKVSKILFLAPAFKALSGLSDDFQQWREKGSLAIEHFHHNRKIDVHYGLIEDLEQYDSYSVPFDIPAIIIHGKNDESVSFQYSVDFAAGKPNVKLTLVDDDHSLTESLDLIWQHVIEFFEI